MSDAALPCSTARRAGRSSTLRALGALGTLGALGLGASACPPDYGEVPRYVLEGSLQQVMELGYDTAKVAVSASDVALTFVRQQKQLVRLPDGGMSPERQTIEDYPLIVSYRLTEDETVDAARRFELATPEGDAGPRGVAMRNVKDDPRARFPDIRVGSMGFDRGLTPGATVRGDFHITFANGIDAASGRTVFGNFDAKVTQ